MTGKNLKQVKEKGETFIDLVRRKKCIIPVVGFCLFVSNGSNRYGKDPVR